MKLIHVRVYAHDTKEIKPYTSTQEVELIQRRESNFCAPIIKILKQGGLEVNKDYVIIVSNGEYTGHGNWKEMEFEVFDL